jgi:hypothetical protein
MARRKRKPDPDPVIARPPRWMLFGSIGLVVLLVWPPIAAVLSDQAGPGMILLGIWPVLVVVLIWRSRLVVDGDGVAFTFLATRKVPWSRIEALVGVASKSGLRSPYLRVRDDRPIPINPFWRAEGGSVTAAIEPWARRKRVRVEGPVDESGQRRPRLLFIGLLIALGGVIGLIAARLSAA